MSSRWLILLMLTLGVLASCGKEQRDPCLQPRDAVLRLHCMHYVDTAGTPSDTLLPNPLLIPIDSKTPYIFGGVKRLSSFPVSLSEVSDSCQWVLRPDSASSVADTINFFYTRNLHFISNACGYTYFFHVDRVTTTRNAIDSAILVKADVSTDNTSEHLRLIY